MTDARFSIGQSEICNAALLKFKVCGEDMFQHLVSQLLTFPKVRVETDWLLVKKATF